MPISVIIDNQKIETRLTNFSDGGEYLKLDLPKMDINFAVVSITKEPAGRVLWLATQAAKIINEQNTADVLPSMTLTVPYLPFARADRVFEEGMVCPLEVFFSEVSAHYDQVYTIDPHNEEAAMRYARSAGMNLLYYTQDRVFLDHYLRNDGLIDKNSLEKNYTLVAPDKGAKEKALKIFEKRVLRNLFNGMIVCDKVRNPVNGWITSIQINEIIGEGDGEAIEGADMIIVDDICDGGMTFIMTAEMLKSLGAKSVTLFVTHGIFSKGLKPFEGVIDKIYTQQLVTDHITESELDNFNNRG